MFLFLGSWRATLIPTIAVPVSLIGTFVVLNAIGYSANSVSLLALVLAIAIVVDDAIVVVANVEHMIETHPELSVADATKRAMTQITAPIVAITMVVLSVFVPMAFIPGISGELFRQFAVTVAVSIFLSAVNALTLSPALCAILLKRHDGPRRGVLGMVMRGIDLLRDGYGVAVGRLVRISFIGLVMVAVATVGTGLLSRITPTGFLAEDDQGAFFVVAQYRANVDDIYRINVRTKDGQMVPLRSLAEVRVIVGPQALVRYNNRLAVAISGSPAPGVSSGQALAAVEQVARATLPPGYQGNGPTYRSRKSGRKAKRR